MIGVELEAGRLDLSAVHNLDPFCGDKWPCYLANQMMKVMTNALLS
jgi:hypothetical protein